MRVVLIGPVYPYRGGIAHYTTLFAQTLVARGHETQLISFSRQYPGWLYPGQSDVDPSANPLIAHDPKYWIDSINPLTWGQTFWRIWRFQPDVLILQWWTTFLAPLWIVLGGLFRLTTNRPLVFICHNVLPHEPHLWDTWLARFALRWGSNFVVQSDAEKERLLQIIPSAAVTVVPMPAFHMFEGAKVDRLVARKELGIAQDAQVMLFFGIVRAYKGLDLLLDTMAEVRQEIDKLSLWIVGEFWENKHEYLRQIEQLGLTDCVTITDKYIPNEELATYFSAADVLVAPYRYVTGSAVAQIAVSFGLPVLPDNIIPNVEPFTHEDSLHEHASESVDNLAKQLVHFFAGQHRSADGARYKAESNREASQLGNVLSAEAKARWQYLAQAIESASLVK